MKYLSDSKRNWLIGGAIGVLVCILLFAFYWLIFFPIIPAIEYKYGEDHRDWEVIVPMATGHIFPMVSSFMVEGSPLPQLFCKATVPVCISWSATANGLPCDEWTIDTGEIGCCMEKIMTPETACTDRLELAVFIFFSACLLLAYFIAGAAIA